MVDIHNNIFWNNYAKTGGDIYRFNLTGTVNAYNNILNPEKVNEEFNSEGSNINTNPLFVDEENGNYHLSDNSLCIDAGNSSAPSLQETDYEGDPRTLGTAPDIGADEYIPGSGAYMISGQIVFEGVGLQGVKVNLTGTAIASRTTDEDGRYSFPALTDGQYTVSPVHAFYDFGPVEQAVTINGSNRGGISFTALAKDSDLDGVFDHVDNCPYNANPDQSNIDGDDYGDICDLPGSISGRVVDGESGLGIEGIKVEASGKYCFTDVFGNYKIENLSNDVAHKVKSNLMLGYDDEYYDNQQNQTYATYVNVYSAQDTSGIDFALSTVSGHPSADAGGPYNAPEGTATVLDASNSYDPSQGGSITRYYWDINNDGIYDYNSTSATYNYAYAQDGTYTIRLKVVDKQNYTDVDTTTATIEDSVPNVNFSGTPLSGDAPLTVNFTNSTTGHDEPLTYEWDFGDNSLHSSETSPSHQYANMGTYSVTLTATDSDGDAISLSIPSYITACSPYYVRIGGASPSYYSSLQEAYDAAMNWDTIQSMGYTFLEDLYLDRDVTVTMQGGYDCTYQNIFGSTGIEGNVTISGGKATLKEIVIENDPGGGGAGSAPLFIPEGLFFSPLSSPTSTPGFIE